MIKNTTQIKNLIFFTLVTLLTGCSSPPVELKHYLLDQKLDVYKNTRVQGDIRVELQRIKLARYLQQSQLAILQQDNQLYFASQHVWAEELHHGISRALVNDINLDKEIHIFTPSEPGNHQSQYQLELQIDHLVATDDAKVILAGKLWLLDGKKVKASTPFYFHSELQGDGFSQAVTQQRQLLSQLAQKIIELLRQ